MLVGSGVKAMPGSIHTPNSGSLKKNLKIQVAKLAHQKNKNIIVKLSEMEIFFSINFLFLRV
jgi:hypothetical protein